MNMFNMATMGLFDSEPISIFTLGFLDVVFVAAPSCRRHKKTREMLIMNDSKAWQRINITV